MEVGSLVLAWNMSTTGCSSLLRGAIRPFVAVTSPSYNRVPIPLGIGSTDIALEHGIYEVLVRCREGKGRRVLDSPGMYGFQMVRMTNLVGRSTRPLFSSSLYLPLITAVYETREVTPYQHPDLPDVSLDLDLADTTVPGPRLDCTPRPSRKENVGSTMLCDDWYNTKASSQLSASINTPTSQDLPIE